MQIHNTPSQVLVRSLSLFVTLLFIAPFASHAAGCWQLATYDAARSIGCTEGPTLNSGSWSGPASYMTLYPGLAMMNSMPSGNMDPAIPACDGSVVLEGAINTATYPNEICYSQFLQGDSSYACGGSDIFTTLEYMIGGGTCSAPPPTVTISVSPTTISSGQSTTISWSSTNATSCTASGGWSGSKTTGGSQSSGPLVANSTFTLTCTGPGGTTPASATVTVGAPQGYTVNVTSIVCDDESYLPNRAGGADITPTTATNFLANPTNAANCRLQSGVGFEWGDDNTTYPPNWNTVTGPIGASYGWNTLGFTDASGRLTTFVPYNPATMSGGGFRIREMLPVGHIPFFGVTNAPSVSAEMYCNKDVEAYDNNETFVGYEVPPNPTTLNAHCVAWNVPADLCGSADGQNLAAAPSGGSLCSSGTASAVSGTGPWTWQCSLGSVVSSCSANLVAGSDILSSCPFTPGNGQYVFTFRDDEDKLLNYGTAAPSGQPYHERTQAVPVTLPGTFDILAYSYDGYITRSTVAPALQLSERFYVDLFNGGNVVPTPYSGFPSGANVQQGGTLVGTYGPTDDLVDGVNFADISQTIGNDVSISEITSLRVRHIDAPGGSSAGASSVIPKCVALSPALPMLPCAGNLLSNGNFEETTGYMSGWNKDPLSYLGGNWFADGARGAFVTSGESIYQTVPATPGNTYTLRFYAGSHDPLQDESVSIEYLNGSGVVIGTPVSQQITNDVDVASYPYLTSYTISSVAPAGAVSVRVRARNNGTNIMKTDAFCLTTGGTAGDITVTPALNYGTIPVGTSEMLPVTITHTSGGSVTGTLTFPNIGVNGVYSCQGNPTCAFTVSALSNTATINVVLTANQVAPLGGNATVVSNAPTKNITITANGDDRAILEVRSVADGVRIPTDSASPFSVLPFGNVLKAGGSVTRDFTVRNLGATPLNYAIDMPAGPNAMYYSCSGTCNGAGMVNGQTENFTITFNPNPVGGTLGDKSASVSVRNTSGVPGGVTPIVLDLSATIIANQPIIDVIPGANPIPNVTVTTIPGGYEVDFGDVLVNTDRTRTIALFNDGDMPMDVSYPASGVPFIISAGAQNDIAPATFHPLLVTFRPQVPGIVQRNLTVTTDGYSGGTVLVRLKGNGTTAPDLTFSGDAGTFNWGGLGNLNYGTHDVTLPPIYRVVTIENTGSADTTLTFSGGESAYSVVPVTGYLIPAGASRDFRIYFDPELPTGSHSGTYTITATGLPGQTQIIVNGIGEVTPPVIAIDQALDFGRVIVGREKSITTNIRNNDTPILARDFGTPNMLTTPVGIFECTAGCSPNPSLPYNASRSITIKFTPTAVMNYSGSLDFIDGGTFTGTWFSIPITGQGVRPSIQYKEN